MSEPESVRSITRRFVENYRRKRFLAMVADREFVEEPLPAVLEQIWAEAEMPLSKCR
jgi:hypothetical protein